MKHVVVVVDIDKMMYVIYPNDIFIDSLGRLMIVKKMKLNQINK